MQEEKTTRPQGKQSGAPPSHSPTSTSSPTPTHPAPSSATPTNTAPSPASMSPFPPEVLDMVLEYLPHRHLVKCVRVNSLFYDVAIKRLYRTVVLKRNGPWPTLVGPAKGRSSNPARQNTRLRGAQLVKYIRIVEVKAHDASLCAHHHRQKDTRTLDSPRALQVVRVILPDVVGGRYLHIRGNLHCYFAQDLRPTTLVIRNAPFAFSSVPNVSTICNHLASRYVYVVTPDKQPIFNSGDCRVWPDRASGMYGLLYSLPKGTTELVVVFHTPGPTFYWRTQPPLYLPLNRGRIDTSAWPNLVPQIDHDLLKSVAHLDKTWLHSIVADLAMFVRGYQPIGDDDAAWSSPQISNLRVTLVNTSSLGPAGWGSSGPLRYDMQTILYWSLYDAVYTPNKDEMERRMDRVTFLTMVEFLEGEDWFGVFEPEEAAPWMKPNTEA